MPDLDDLPIQRREDDSWSSGSEGIAELTQRRPPRRSPWRLGLLFAVVAVLMAVGFFVWRQLSRPPAPEVGRPVEPEAHTPPPVEAPSDREPEPAAVGWSLPTLEDSDGVLRTMVAALSSHPRLAAWLVHDGVIRRFTLVVANVAFDEDPRPHAPFLRPEAQFAASAIGEGWEIAPGSYRRFDLLVDVFESIDPEGAVDLYLRFLPLIDQTFEELGYPGDFGSVLHQAAARVLETPEVGADLAVKPWINRYLFEDPRLEALAPAQKILLGMGPANRTRVEDQLRRLLAELDRRRGG